ncbi:MAG: LytTR family DNA-binding domain-containing protein [Bacteroidota bacterium]
MKVFIVEDEPAARRRLFGMLVKTYPEIELVGAAESVVEAVKWIANNPPPDLAFFDVQLADDFSFQIFEIVEVNFPIVFTTAYDKYVLEALEHNSVDYMLKPITEERLSKALSKVKKLESHFIFQNLKTNLSTKEPKRRFLVKKGIDYVSVEVENVAYFFTEHKLSFLRDTSGTTYIIDSNITDLLTQVDTKRFFRVNRKYLVHINAIERFKSDIGKIELYLKPVTKEKVTVSKENAPNFRKWIEG